MGRKASRGTAKQVLAKLWPQLEAVELCRSRHEEQPRQILQPAIMAAQPRLETLLRLDLINKIFWNYLKFSLDIDDIYSILLV